MIHGTDGYSIRVVLIHIAESNFIACQNCGVHIIDRIDLLSETRRWKFQYCSWAMPEPRDNPVICEIMPSSRTDFQSA